MKPMTQPQLVALIEDMHRRIEAGDSWEGHLTYLMPDPDQPVEIVAMVEARYRVGNLEGQGGMFMFGVGDE